MLQHSIRFTFWFPEIGISTLLQLACPGWVSYVNTRPESHTTFFQHAQLLSRWGYIICHNDGAIMSQVSHNLTTVEKPKQLDQAFNLKLIQYGIRMKHLILIQHRQLKSFD